MREKKNRLFYLVWGVLVMMLLFGTAGCRPSPPASMPPPDPPPLPDILIRQEPAERFIANTIGETRTFSITTSEPATITWTMMRIREGPAPPATPWDGLYPPRAEPEKTFPLPEPVPPPPVALGPPPAWQIREDLNVTFSEVTIPATELGHFTVDVSARMVVDGEIRGGGGAIWNWEIGPAP